MTPRVRTTTTRGRFQAALDEPSLIEAVADACRELKPQAPHTVTPAQFDALLVRDADREVRRYAGIPRARSLRRRLAGLGWYELLALIFDTERSTEHYLAIRRRRTGRDVGQDECVVALRTVAARLGAPTVRPHEFVAARRDVVGTDTHAWLHGTDQEWWFPTAAQVEGVFRTDKQPGWDRALSAAGLDARPTIGGSKAGMPAVQAMELFLYDMGCLPWGRRALREYAAARGFSVAFASGSWENYVAELRMDRTLLGLWMPPAAPPRGQRPPDVCLTQRQCALDVGQSFGDSVQRAG